MQMGAFRGFEVQVHDPGICVITMNQPERMNGTTTPMKRDMGEVLLHAQMDRAVRVVVITGSGRAFSAGDDITGRRADYGDAQKVMPSLPRGGPGRSEIGTYTGLRMASQPLNLMIRSMDKLTIAAVNGVAIQTGMSLALSCDFRIASTEARIGSGTLRFGMQPDEGGHFLVTQLVGVAKAMDFFMRNRILSGAEALDWGLVHEVVEPGELMDRTMAVARELAEGPQVAMRLLKRSIYKAAEVGMLEAFDDIAVRTAISDHHPDVRAGAAAFRNKTKPRFNAWLDEDPD